MSSPPNRPQLECARPTRCTWKLGTQEKDPHFHKPLTPFPKIVDNVLDCIGRTPLVRLQKIPKMYDLKCEVLVKAEYFNSGGSVKDRIAIRMIEEAERKGLIKPGWTLIEPTSGNTGIGIALAAAVKGYKCIIVMPEKMSTEKADVLKLLGAEIIRTPTSAASDSPDSHIGVAKKLCDSMETGFILDQYMNEGNPLAHYDGTGEEIIQQTDGKVDMIVGGVGTGGTMSGIARKIKEKIPSCKIVGVDPEGSILAHEEHEIIEENYYEVEGIGYDFYPTVFDRKLIDKWYKSNDEESFKLSRELILHEGLLCGGSSGAAMVSAIKAAKELNENQRVVVILPDGVRNYMSKFVNDEWMIQRNFEVKENHENDPSYYKLPITKLGLNSTNLLTIDENFLVSDALKLMSDNKLNELPVLCPKHKNLIGLFTTHQAMKSILANKLNFNDKVSKCNVHDFPKVKADESIGKLCKLMNRFEYVILVEHKDKTDFIINFVRHSDILNFISKQ